MNATNKWKSYGGATVAILTVWWGFSYILPNLNLPTPLQVAISFPGVIKEGLWWHFIVSFYRVAASILLGTAFALPIGLIAGRSERLNKIVSPFISLLYPIPKIVFLPIFILLFGFGDWSKIALISFIIFFQIVVTTRDGAKAVSQQMIIAMHSLNASNWDIYRHTVIPATLPKVFTALRITTGTAIAVLFFAESFATQAGIGYAIMYFWGRFDQVGMFCGIVAMAFLGIIYFEFWDLLEKTFCGWTKLV